jgi:hypothetical protein
MKPVVFIPSRSRAWLLESALPKWKEQDISHVYLVIEKKDYNDYRPLWQEFDNVAILTLPKSDQGINYSRNWIVQEAHDLGYNKIIMSDDDIFPHPESDVKRLFEWKDLNCLGIGVMMPFYGLMFGNQTIKNEDRPLMSTNALGKRLFSLNIPRVMACGNFDPRLHSGWGDDELVREGMAKLEATWYIHAGVRGVSTANRYTRGGINDFHGEDQESRLRGQDVSHEIIFKKWGGKYISMPGKRMQCRWKIFMNDFVPDWEERIDWSKE